MDGRIQNVDDATRFRERMVKLAVTRVRDDHEQTGDTVNLVGWSMGGLDAPDASPQLPDITRQVITLGSPFGDPQHQPVYSDAAP